jgi:hypothetical protein
MLQSTGYPLVAASPGPLHLTLTLQSLLHQVECLQTYLALGYPDVRPLDHWGQTTGRIQWSHKLLVINIEDMLIILIMLVISVRRFNHTLRIQSF